LLSNSFTHRLRRFAPFLVVLRTALLTDFVGSRRSWLFYEQLCFTDFVGSRRS